MLEKIVTLICQYLLKDLAKAFQFGIKDEWLLTKLRQKIRKPKVCIARLAIQNMNHVWLSIAMVLLGGKGMKYDEKSRAIFQLNSSYWQILACFAATFKELENKVTIDKVQKIIVQHWNFASPIFQANQALTERLVRESALVQPVPDQGCGGGQVRLGKVR